MRTVLLLILFCTFLFATWFGFVMYDMKKQLRDMHELELKMQESLQNTLYRAEPPSPA